MSCEKHLKEVAGISDMKVLAEMIGDLHYETLTILFYRLAEKINADYRKDWMAGRDALASALKEANKDILNAAEHFEQAWKISAPFMKQ